MHQKTSKRYAATSDRLTMPSILRVSGSITKSLLTPGTESLSTTDLYRATCNVGPKPFVMCKTVPTRAGCRIK